MRDTKKTAIAGIILAATSLTTGEFVETSKETLHVC